MATIKYDAVATIRYQQNGEDKKRYHKMGVVFETPKGLSMKLESIPVGFDGWVSLYEPKPKPQDDKQSAKPATDRANTFDDMTDDIPWK